MFKRSRLAKRAAAEAAAARAREQQAEQQAPPPPKQDYLDHCHRTYSCIHCRAHLANHDELISKLFQGNHGRAYLFNSVVNVACKQAITRELLTGLHAVCDIYCKTCETTLGWKYEQAFVASQKYKEGKFIIELVHMLKENNSNNSCGNSSSEPRDVMMSYLTESSSAARAARGAGPAARGTRGSRVGDRHDRPSGASIYCGGTAARVRPRSEAHIAPPVATCAPTTSDDDDDGENCRPDGNCELVQSDDNSNNNQSKQNEHHHRNHQLIQAPNQAKGSSANSSQMSSSASSSSSSSSSSTTSTSSFACVDDETGAGDCAREQRT